MFTLMELRLLATLNRHSLKELSRCISTTELSITENIGIQRRNGRIFRSERDLKGLPNFHLIYPDFLRAPVWDRRNPLKEKLERRDMLNRRANIDIPEFYVGSVLAVTLADQFAPGRKNRFLGICIRREKTGLHHNFTLRNFLDGLGVEIRYDLYNPCLMKIETLLLERRLDDNLTYLQDALPEYSTFPFDMEPIPHPAGSPVPINPLKVISNNPLYECLC